MLIASNGLVGLAAGQVHPFVVLVAGEESARCSNLPNAANLAVMRHGAVLDESTGRFYDGLECKSIDAEQRSWW